MSPAVAPPAPAPRRSSSAKTLGGSGHSRRSEEQVIEEVIAHRRVELVLPPAGEELTPNLRWGRVDRVFTPAYWRYQCWLVELGVRMPQPTFALGRSLEEEVVACLLGGYGNPAEVGLAAFAALRDAGLATGTPSEEEIHDELSRPLRVGDRLVKYRFARARARYVAASLRRIADRTPPADDFHFREWLTSCPGIGRKTASWVTRNFRASDQVAILDVHILRAGVALGIFPIKHDVSRDYLTLEHAFLTFASSLGVRASVLDALMWNDLRRAGYLLYARVMSSDGAQLPLM